MLTLLLLDGLVDYCETVVAKMGEDARDVVVCIVPLAFRIGLAVVLVDSKEKTQQNLQMETLRFPGKSRDYDLQLEDSLNLPDKTLTLLLSGGHYNMIYSNDHPIQALKRAEPLQPIIPVKRQVLGPVLEDQIEEEK